MIILLAYVNYPITTAVYLNRALRQIHNVHTIGPPLPEVAIEEWSLQNMRLPMDNLDINTSFTPDMAILLENTPPCDHPDLYLWVESIKGYYPKNLNALKCPKACYLIDTHYHLMDSLEMAKLFDYVFIAQLIDLEAFRAVHPRVYWLPLACDPDIHGRHDVPKIYDVGFVGGMNPRRQQILDFLAQHVSVHREKSFWRDMARTFSTSRIVLNHASFDDLNMRFFEALASGSLLLSNHTTGSGQDILFKDGKEYACYNYENLLEVVRHYLADENLREHIADQGRQRVLAAHTYRHRMDDLLNVLLHGKSDTFSPEELRQLSCRTDEHSFLHTASQRGRNQERILTVRNIITDRLNNRWPTWQMIHEWENVLSQELKAGLKPLTEDSLVTNNSYSDQDCDLIFITLASQLVDFIENNHLIPIVMDLYQKDFELFRTCAARFPLVYVTSLQVHREMCNAGLDNIRYLPFSVADKYLAWSRPPKEIDLIQFGRTNPLLDEFMLHFLKRHTEIEYVTTCRLNGKIFFHSNKVGVLYESASRSIFMHTLARAKISLVSTPGMDNSRETNGLDAVSPRFYESIAARCHMVGRIPDNDEIELLGIRPLCSNINHFEEFEETVIQLLHTECNQNAYNSFLQRNVTSQRAKIILNDCR